MSAKRMPRVSQRKGAALTYIAVIMLTLLGFGALAVDLGYKFVVRVDLQSAAEASALAAAGALATDDGSASHIQRGVNAAVLYASKQTSVGMNNQGLVLNPSDVVFGDAVFVSGNRWDISMPPTTNTPYAVQVTVRRDGQNNPQVPYFFGRIWNLVAGTQIATSTAMVAPRDIAIVLDLSGSMHFDTVLSGRNNVQINLRDIWVTLKSVGESPQIRTVPGVGDFPQNYVLATETASAYASQIGDTFGSMSVWGTAILQNQYNQTAVTNDLGMYFLPPSQAWNTSTTLGTGAGSPKYAWIVTNTANPYSLTSRGLTAAEINRVLVPPGTESTANHNLRLQIILGFSNWTDANANGLIDAAEVTVAVDEPYNLGAGWNEWFNYVRGGYGGNSYFTNRYGIKSYVNWLLEDGFGMVAGAPGSLGYTPRIQFTPIAKLQPCKDAILGMAMALKGSSNQAESSDRVGLVTFGSTAAIDPYSAANGLTSNFDRIGDLAFPHQPGDMVGTATNTPAALVQAFIMLQGQGSRPFSHKMIVLLTDGIPTVDNHYRYVDPTVPANTATLNAVTNVTQFQNLFTPLRTSGFVGAPTETLNVARILTSGKLGLGSVEIIAVGVGSDANQSFLNQLAALSDGTAYMAVPNINDPAHLGNVLLQIFQHVASQRPVAIIK